MKKAQFGPIPLPFYLNALQLAQHTGSNPADVDGLHFLGGQIDHLYSFHRRFVQSDLIYYPVF